MNVQFLWESTSYVIWIAALIGIIRYNRINPTFRPFLYFIWWAALNECISSISIRIWAENAINSNVYVLAEFILLVWLFKNWNQNKYPTWFFQILWIGGTILWVIDNLFIHSIVTFNSFFRVCYSFVIVYLSVEEITGMLKYTGTSNVVDPKFIICTTFIIYFTYKAIFEVFFLIDFGMSKAFFIQLYGILVVVNLISNLLYSLSTLCIQKKKKLFLPY